MRNICKNCGKDIRVMVFRGTDWCSDRCRRILLGKVKCSYEEMWTDEVGYIPVCTIHGHDSMYGPEKGPHRPCRFVEDEHDL